MTHSRLPGGRASVALAAALLLAGAATTAGVAAARAAPAAGCYNWTGAPALDPGASNEFTSIAISSACDVWAVGAQAGSGVTATLIEHWNGSAWAVVPSPDPSDFSRLRGVRGTSADDVWAVGDYIDGTVDKTLILH